MSKEERQAESRKKFEKKMKEVSSASVESPVTENKSTIDEQLKAKKKELELKKKELELRNIEKQITEIDKESKPKRTLKKEREKRPVPPIVIKAIYFAGGFLLLMICSSFGGWMQLGFAMGGIMLILVALGGIGVKKESEKKKSKSISRKK